jgi:thiamine kinase-like enzyme
MSLYFDIELNVNEESTNQYKELALKSKPEWPQDQEKIEIKCFVGGLTNALYACYLKSTGLDTKDTVLIRIYGHSSDTVCDRDKEIESMKKLSSIGLGAAFYARFKNGICYQYLPGSKISKEMLYNKSMYTKVAKGISRIRIIIIIINKIFKHLKICSFIRHD